MAEQQERRRTTNGYATSLKSSRQGTRRDAVLHSVGANATHGLKRTNADKRRSVETLLNDPEWAKWSGEEIARRAGVSPMFVSNMRKEMTLNRLESSVRIGADGRTYNTANIGRTSPPLTLPSSWSQPVVSTNGHAEPVIDERTGETVAWIADTSLVTALVPPVITGRNECRNHNSGIE